MTEIEFQNLMRGSIIIANKTEREYYTKGKTYKVKSIGRYGSICTTLDDVGNSDNGWHRRFFSVAPIFSVESK